MLGISRSKYESKQPTV